MRRHFKTAALLLAGLLLSAVAAQAPPPAQGPATELQRLHDAFQQRRMKAAAAHASLAELTALTERFVEELRDFLGRAEGRQRTNARLMLVDYLLSLGKREQAIEALRGMPATAPALALAAAAEFAQFLGLEAERAGWIEAALARPASFEERMALAMQLMTRLQEIDKGQAVINAAFEAAEDDEARARVRWYEAAALREREDLPEGTYDAKLEALAATYPDTFWGGIARDTLKARELQVGSDAIPFALKTRDGSVVRLADLAGKVVLLDFWASWSQPWREIAPELAEVYRERHDQGFEIVGIAMDTSVAAALAAVDQLDLPWEIVADGRGAHAEGALRYGIQMPPRWLLIGRDGKVAAMHLFPFNPEGMRAAVEAIDRALSSGGSSEPR